MQGTNSTNRHSKGKTPAVTPYEQPTQARPLGFIPSKLITDITSDVMVYNELELLPVRSRDRKALIAALEKLHAGPISKLGIRITRLSGDDVGPREEFVARHSVRLSFDCGCSAQPRTTPKEEWMHGIETWENSVVNVEGAEFKEESCRIDGVMNLIMELKRRVKVKEREEEDEEEKDEEKKKNREA